MTIFKGVWEMELFNKIRVLERFINMDKRRKSVFIKCANSSFAIPHKMLLLLANPDEIIFDDEEKECGDFLDRNLELSKITIAEIENAKKYYRTFMSSILIIYHELIPHLKS